VILIKRKFDVYIPDGHKITKPEREAAWILAKHYRATVHFIRPSNEYMVKSADFRINDREYELKSPTSKNIHHIEKIIKLASKQSSHIIIDMRKTRITEDRMISLCENLIKNIKKLNKILLIVNKKKIIDFYK